MSPRTKTAPAPVWKRENAWSRLPAKERRAVEAYGRHYMAFLSAAKTEREAFDLAVAQLQAQGFVDLDHAGSHSGRLAPGTRVYRGWRGKTLMAAIVGTHPLEDGLHIVGGHTDAPRLDTKPVPLYEEGGVALLDTHYYGGVKKYQWVAMPLALHGVVVRQDGTRVPVCIGEAPGDPVLTITDLLPHLGKDQATKTMADGISGEGLNVLVGSLPAEGAGDDAKVKDKVKLNLVRWLQAQYGITEEDLSSAELELVPAGPARDLGLDRSMILGYGHDDRVCAYAGLRALLDLRRTPAYTAMVLLCDKEEIGSVGATGMDSRFLENTVAEMLALAGNGSDLALRRCLERSRMLSADVNALHDPNYPDVSSPNNMAQINAGVVVAKYTGSRGKSGSSDASAEFMAEIRRVFNQAGVVWQTGELGKVDGGGGGTIALFLARYGMDVVDCGVGLFSMHAPWEVAGKLDTYMAFKGYQAFLAHDRQ